MTLRARVNTAVWSCLAAFVLMTSCTRPPDCVVESHRCPLVEQPGVATSIPDEVVDKVPTQLVKRTQARQQQRKKKTQARRRALNEARRGEDIWRRMRQQQEQLELVAAEAGKRRPAPPPDPAIVPDPSLLALLARRGAEARPPAEDQPPTATARPQEQVVPDRPDVDLEELRVGDLAPGEQLHNTPEDLIRRIKNVGANRNLVGLKRYMTEGLAVRITALVERSPERFWQHLAKYVVAADHGFDLESRPGELDDSLRLEVTARGGIKLRPLVVKSSKGYLFDRF